MRRVLLIKLTSLGDLIHALPALSDAQSARPGIEFDWVIDESFQEIAAWHPAVSRVITTNHREWRGALASVETHGSISKTIGEIRASEYDLVIDGQGNFKTALLCLFARGTRAGFDSHSVRDWTAHLAYHRPCAAATNAQPIASVRRPSAPALDPQVQVLPRPSLSEIGYVIERSKACVCMDTRLSDLAAALDVPSITLYGSTDSGLIGASGASQVHLKSDLHCSPCREKTCRYSSRDNPCLEKIGPERVFGELLRLTGSASGLRQVPVSPVSASAQRAS